jgi:hypothetical protein
MKRLALVALIAAAALIPAAAASGGHQAAKIRRGLIPLQTAQLGPAGASLALNYDSGSISSYGDLVVEVDQEGGVRLDTYESVVAGTQGLLGGYVLDYGDPYTGSVGVTDIRSSIAEYRTRADARNGLAAARQEDAYLKDEITSTLPYLAVTEKSVKPSPVGQRGFGYLLSQAAPNLNPIVELDEQVAAGRFVLDLTVTAGSASAAEEVAPQLLHVLQHRLQRLLGGHATGTSVPHAPKLHAGQAPGAPDLSTMVLQPTDVGQSHSIYLFEGYSAAPPALEDYDMTLQPAGTYGYLDQQLGWWPTATEATYAEIYGAPDASGGFGIGIGFAAHPARRGGGVTVTPVDLSSVQDPATGYLVTGDGESEALVTVTNGQAGESIVGLSHSTLQVSDVVSLAQAAANRLDAGLGP